MTQKDFASKIGLSRSYLGDLENNRKSPSADTITKLSKSLGVSEAYLFSGKDDSLASYIVDVLESANEIKDDYNTIWLARNPLIITNRWKEDEFPNEEEVIKAYKAFKEEQLDTKEEYILRFGKEIYAVASKRNEILSDLEKFEKLSLDEKHKKLDEVSRHLKEVIFWYRKHFGLTPKEAHEEYNEFYNKNK